jgi:integrase
MAWLEREESGRYHVAFRFGNNKFKRSLKTDSETEAQTRLFRLEENIRLVESGRMTMPEGADAATFLLSDGKLERKIVIPAPTLLAPLLDKYCEDLPEGVIESNSLYTAKIHINHLKRVLGTDFQIARLGHADLQSYVVSRTKQKGRRAKPISPVTIKKELSTFSTIWSWAMTRGYVNIPFPNKNLRFPKTAEKPPFQTWKTIELQISRGGLSEVEKAELWDCLFLTLADISQLLEYVRVHATVPFLYPMCVMAAHTGARRSEIVRSQVNDLDIEAHTVLIHEKKRARGRRTTRSVPLSPTLHKVITDWLKVHPGGNCTFAWSPTEAPSQVRTGVAVPLLPSDASDLLDRTLHGSRWANIRGWHIFRHSFISNCAAKGIDQRIIDAWSGHQTDEMRKRYLHLFPDTQQQAMLSVFGNH